MAGLFNMTINSNPGTIFIKKLFIRRDNQNFALPPTEKARPGGRARRPQRAVIATNFRLRPALLVKWHAADSALYLFHFRPFPQKRLRRKKVSPLVIGTATV